MLEAIARALLLDDAERAHLLDLARAARAGAVREPGRRAQPQQIRPSAAEFYPDWEEAADTTVSILRTEAGRDPYNRALTDLVGELATRSDTFRTRWAAHDVRLHHTGTKRFRHPLVGDLTVGFNATELPADPGLTLTVYTAEPGSGSAEKLALLASWGATTVQRHQDVAAHNA